MAYTPVTSINSPVLSYSQWSRPDAPNPRLAAPISATDTTLTFTDPLLDRDGAVIATAFLFAIKNSEGYTETCLCPAAGLDADGTTATGVVRGIRPDGLDCTTGDTAFAAAFDADSPVVLNISAIIQSITVSALTAGIGANIKFNGRPLYMGTGVGAVPVFATTVARDAALVAPANGDSCYVTADGVFYDYQGGAWVDRATGSTPNATTAVAGKVELATQGENDAGTAIGGTGASLVATPAIAAATVQKGVWTYGASATGNDTYVVTLAPAPAAYTNGMVVNFKPDTANTGPATLNVNALGAVDLTSPAGTALATGDIVANQIVQVVYNSTGPKFQMQSLPAGAFVSKSTFTTKGDILATTAVSSPTRLGVGTDGQILSADSVEATGLKWVSPLNVWTSDVQAIASGVGGVVDTTLTPGFQASVIKISYHLHGTDSGAAEYTVGEAMFEGTSVKGGLQLCKNATAGAAFNPTTSSISSAINVNDANGVYLTVALSVSSITATQIVVRLTVTSGGGAGGQTQYFQVTAWK